MSTWPLKVWIGVFAGSVLPVLAIVGFARLDRYVHGLERYDRSLVLKWIDLPEWLRVTENRHVLDSLARRIDLRPTDDMLDRRLSERIGRALSDPGIGWIKAVDRVRVEPDGAVSIKCRFRTPAAWVRRGAFCYLIDEASIRLPGKYEAAHCVGTALGMIEGAAAPPPAVGVAWPGDDLAAGLRLSALLDGKPFRHQIRSVIVANYRGRLDRAKPHLELATDRNGSRVWWGRPPDEENGTEISAAQKLILLETMYRQTGRIDMNGPGPYVNIMTWPDRVAMPAAMQAPAQGRLLRG